ncbi:hypothetical protein [Hyalangium gracile]|uniref:hypothetical protein n=1 Tax=Hyalangium gracile TaxID=394092 RepID=UPI001CCE0FF3|nr:hypothetical protein [Hyalangium gracile]
MSERRIRRWALLAALVSTALLAPACERSLPEAGTENEGLANEAQKLEPSDAARQEATGGSGFQQPEEGAAPRPEQGQQRGIGAPGYSDSREQPRTDQGYDEPNPELYESGAAPKTEKRLMPTPEPSPE